MESQLEAVRQDMRNVKDEILEVKQGLAVAEHALPAHAAQSRQSTAECE